jgi:hypothetical protein
MSMLVRLTVLLMLAYAAWRYMTPKQPTVAPDPSVRPVEELKQCPRCQTYVATGAGRCGRADCPR